MPLTRHPSRLISAALIAATAGCDAFGGACTLSIEPAIIVQVRDSSGIPRADSAQGFVIDGTYTDSLRWAAMDSLGRVTALRGADERAGTYAVLITRPGYLTWSRSGVQVRDGDCHVRSVTLEAVLAPTP